MQRESIITLVLGLVVGLLVGSLSTQRKHRLPEKEQVAVVQPLLSKPTVVSEPDFVASWEAADEEDWGDPPFASDDLDDAQRENKELQQQMVDLLEWIGQNLPQSTPRTRQSFSSSGENVLTRDRRLTPEAAQHLHLSPASVETINAALEETYAAMVALRENSMEIRKRRNNGINIRMPLLADEAAPLRSDLERILKQEMGSEAYDVFMQASSTEIDKKFFYFGQGRQSLRFKSYSDKETGEPRIWYQDRYYFSQDEGSTIIYQKSRASSNLPSEYDQYIEWDR